MYDGIQAYGGVKVNVDVKFWHFFYFSTLSSFCPSGAASKREVAGNCQSQIWGWTSHSSLFLCFPNCLENLQNSVKGCHSNFPLQYFFVLFTKSVASVLMLKRLRWIGPFPKLSHPGLHYLNMPSFPNWQPNNLIKLFFMVPKLSKSQLVHPHYNLFPSGTEKLI